MIKKLFFGTFGLGLNIVIYAIIIIEALRIVSFSYNFSYEVFGNVSVVEESDEKVPIHITEGASTDEIASLLKSKDLIDYKEAFVLHVAFSKYKGLIKPGNYELSPSMTMDEMLDIICEMTEDD